MNYFILILASIFIILGLIGVVIPAIPGLPFVFLGVLIYAIFTHFTIITIPMILFFTIMVIISLVLGYSLGIYSTKKLGASSYGIWGGIIGIVVGLIFSPFGLISFIICPILGTVAGELIGGKKLLESSKIGLGSLIGFLIGITIDLIFASIMIFYFIRAIL